MNMNKTFVVVLLITAADVGSFAKAESQSQQLRRREITVTFPHDNLKKTTTTTTVISEVFHLPKMSSLESTSDSSDSSSASFTASNTRTLTRNLSSSLSSNGLLLTSSSSESDDIASDSRSRRRAIMLRSADSAASDE